MMEDKANASIRRQKR